ncbi:MAG: hypothetical protein RBS80_24190 [Thermoguttaceae bacterium]|nr:hypothetical protein [Thermoguttaceae bacterium]
MNVRTGCIVRFAVWSCAFLWPVLATAQVDDILSRTADWQSPKAVDVQARALEWLSERSTDEAIQARFAEIWADGQPAVETALLEKLARTFALLKPQAAELVALCAAPRVQLVAPSQPWLMDSEVPPFEANNLRLLFGRWLVHEGMHDEALEQIGNLNPEDVVAPASLLFYQGVAYHNLLEKEKGLAVLDRLLDGAENSPRRYVSVARLMREDLGGVKPDTLDHIARRMRDIHRRLDLGRAGEKVRGIEDGVIESLDKLIKELEDQQQAAAGGAGAGGSQSSSPAPDSRILGGKGPGDVDRKNIGSDSGWGSLPPKEREEALQQIGRDFPSHYRDVIEEYFRRKAATEESP